jgi:hypothetical protein
MSLFLEQPQQKPATTVAADRENSRRYNRQLREAVGLLIHVSRAAHDAKFKQQKLAAKEQVRQRHSSNKLVGTDLCPVWMLES